jgi:cytochrome c biogenesis protein CcmG, thiol:disulfide interchange protein DsbE
MKVVLGLAGRSRPWSAVMALTLLLGIGWMAWSAVPAAGTTGGMIPSPREGFAAPEFTLPDQDDEPVTLSDLRGSVVVLNLWASWCPPCRAEMPALEQVYRTMADEGVIVLAINTTYQDREVEARRFAAERALTFPILFDRTGEASRAYQLRAMPTTFFVDRQGVIRRVILGGPMSQATIQTALAALLEE